MLRHKGYTLQNGKDRRIRPETAAAIIGVSRSRLSQLKLALPPLAVRVTNERGGGRYYSLRMVINYALAHPVDEARQHSARQRGKGHDNER
jgi:hypothetical protein